MKAFKCDRCGRLFEKKAYMEISLLNQGYNTRMYLSYTDNFGATSNLDLCNSCSRELCDWFENGRCNDDDKEQEEQKEKKKRFLKK